MSFTIVALIMVVIPEKVLTQNFDALIVPHISGLARL